ncbi:hypothetical protein Cgig2_014205 [Carnegiea gigantea]|uniref:Pentatricopeptide repeat-containing protein n=1 Tax=Carnegiea gigantea TaxID=171969 RepID=A0A9Q1JSD2_9CARY|nr:hypothetical protein Cgig2_014205 [Carnegiea gigantea]
MCKSGQVDYAVKIFKAMNMKDEFTYSSMVHNLCRKGRFRTASRLLLSCTKKGMNILKSAKRAVRQGFLHSGFRREARKHLSKIKVPVVSGIRVDSVISCYLHWGQMKTFGQFLMWFTVEDSDRNSIRKWMYICESDPYMKSVYLLINIVFSCL